MKICKFCDHNVKLECQGGCFSPHKTPPCFRQTMESQTAVVQQLKAEISKVLSQSEPYHMYTGETGYRLTKLQYEKLLKLSAV